jgi:hypothetical protein
MLADTAEGERAAGDSTHREPTGCLSNKTDSL